MSTHQGDKSEKLLRCTQRVWHYHCQQLLWQTLIQVPSEFKATGANGKYAGIFVSYR